MPTFSLIYAVLRPPQAPSFITRQTRTPLASSSRQWPRGGTRASPRSPGREQRISG